MTKVKIIECPVCKTKIRLSKNATIIDYRLAVEEELGEV